MTRVKFLLDLGKISELFERVLQQERDDPHQKDLLLRKYAEMELGRIFLSKPSQSNPVSTSSGTAAANIEADDE